MPLLKQKNFYSLKPVTFCFQKPSFLLLKSFLTLSPCAAKSLFSKKLFSRLSFAYAFVLILALSLACAISNALTQAWNW